MEYGAGIASGDKFLEIATKSPVTNSHAIHTYPVTLAKAGIYPSSRCQLLLGSMDSRLRGNDKGRELW
ncbi:MAG: hypothetical protein COC23_06660 [Hyphomicrobiales bacterium]|nr:MAG: hypothetical protein COC23_06660 [Hyphomicrobiales bacterium]